MHLEFVIKCLSLGFSQYYDRDVCVHVPVMLTSLARATLLSPTADSTAE